MNTLYYKFLERLRQINHHMRPGETALEAMARNMVEIVGIEFAELNTTILRSIAAKLDTPPTAQDGYTPTLCEVVKLANIEADRVGSHTIEAHHLLIAIVQEGTSQASLFIETYLNIRDISRLSGYAYELHPFQDKALASAKLIFDKAKTLAGDKQVDVHHLFTALLTIGDKQPTEICHLLSYLSCATDAQRATRLIPVTDERRVTTADQILAAYQFYITYTAK